MKKTCDYGDCENCEYRVKSNDITISNVGTMQEIINLDKKFIGNFHNQLKKIEFDNSKIPEESPIEAGEILTQKDLDYIYDHPDSNSFSVKIKQKAYFINTETKIPKNSEVLRDSKKNLILFDKEPCEYWLQRMIGEESAFSVYNYSSFLSTRLNENDGNNSNLKNELENDNLIIKGERKINSSGQESIKTLSKEFKLGFEIDASTIEATCEDGILTVFVPNYKKRNNINRTIKIS